tara:strand:- start:5376 stop:8261 length:2886 start_codon:yes stop_codon:yes gene_type:complete
MKLDALVESFEASEKATYQELCKLASQPDCDRGLISERCQVLFKEVMDRGSLKGHPGALLGQFWSRFKKKKKKQVEEEINLRELSATLPYPLGYKLREFVLEFEKYQKGYGSSNFPYLVASLNGLALRVLSAMCICEYVYVLEAPDARVNQEVVESLRTPADGTWKGLIDLLVGECGGYEDAVFLGELKGLLKKRRPFPGNRKGLSMTVLFQELVQFRNQLLHGTHSFSEEEIAQAAKKVEALYQSIHFLEGWQIVYVQDEFGVDCTGGSPVFLDQDGLFRLHKKIHHLLEYKAPVCIRRGEDSHVFPLGPLLHYLEVHEHEGDVQDLNEVFFLNGWDNEHLEFISYRYARSQDHRQLHFPYQQFLSFLREIPVTKLPQHAQLDFSGIASFHLERFVGRTLQLQAIASFLASPKRPVGVMKALGGMGKTALLAWFYDRFQRDEEWPEGVFPVWHFCANVDGRDHPVVFLRSVLAQIDSFLEGETKEYPTSIDLLERMFSERLKRIAELKEGQRVILIVDALDEGMSSAGGTSIPSVLPDAQMLPSNMQILVSYRVDRDGLNELVAEQLPYDETKVTVLEGCDPLSGLSWGEMEEMLLQVTGRESIPKETLEAIWKTATQSHEDDFADPFVLRFISDRLEDGDVDPVRPETVPQSLTALFDQFWNQLSVKHDYFLHRLLGMLSVMPEQGSDDMFAKVFTRLSHGERGMTPDEVAERRASINKLLVFSGDMYRLFHSRFREYVRKRFHPRDEALQLHLPLYQFCHSKALDKDLYDLRFRVYHLAALSKHEGLTLLEREGYRQELWELFANDEFIARKFDAFQRMDLVWDDFSLSFTAFLPDPEREPGDVWNQFARTFHLSLRAHQMMSDSVETSRRRLYQFAVDGDVDQVIRIALWGGTAYRRVLQLLLSAVWLCEAGHDTHRIWSVLEGFRAVSWGQEEKEFMEQLLKRSDAPESVRERLFA